MPLASEDQAHMLAGKAWNAGKLLAATIASTSAKLSRDRPFERFLGSTAGTTVVKTGGAKHRLAAPPFMYVSKANLI